MPHFLHFSSHRQFSVIQILTFHKVFQSFKYPSHCLVISSLANTFIKKQREKTSNSLPFLNVKKKKSRQLILIYLIPHTYDIRESKWKEENRLERERDHVLTKSANKTICQRYGATVRGKKQEEKGTYNQLLRGPPKFSYAMRSQPSA